MIYAWQVQYSQSIPGKYNTLGVCNNEVFIIAIMHLIITIIMIIVNTN